MQLKTFLNRNIGNPNVGFNLNYDSLYIHINNQADIKENTEKELSKVYNNQNLKIFYPCCWDVQLKDFPELLKCKVIKSFNSLCELPFHKGEKVLNVVVEVK